MNLKGKKINFLGDSITEGVGASSPDNTYVSLIAEKTGAICRNYGIGGTRIARQQQKSAEERWDLDFCMRVKDMEDDADIIAIFGGTNDYGHGDAPFGNMSDRTPDTFYGALHTLYTSLLEKYTDKTIFVITPLHRVNEDNPRGDGYKKCDSPYLKGYVDAIREVAEYYSLPVLDLYSSGGLQPNVPAVNTKYFADGLHPNDTGYNALAYKIMRFLENM